MHAEMFILDLSVSAFFFGLFDVSFVLMKKKISLKVNFLKPFSLAMRSGLCNGRRKCNEN